MQALYIMIPIGLIILGVAVYVFIWAVDNGQYDDLDTPAYLILFDEDQDVEVDNQVTRERRKIC